MNGIEKKATQFIEAQGLGGDPYSAFLAGYRKAREEILARVLDLPPQALSSSALRELEGLGEENLLDER